MSYLDGISRQKAAELLQQLRQSVTLGDLLSEAAVHEVGELHPATVEKLQRIHTLQAAAEALLKARAAHRAQ